MDLTESQMQVARLLGITEAIANKLRDGIMPKVGLLFNNSKYICIILFPLVKTDLIFIVC
jgi:hypothetical protein